MCRLFKYCSAVKCISLFSLVLFSYPLFSQQKKVNLMEKFKPAGIPVSTLEGSTLVSLNGYNYKLAAFSKDLKFMAVSRSFVRKDSEVMDIVLIRFKKYKETILLDTLTMVRYGRPNGYLMDLKFTDQDMLVAQISDGMKGTSILTFDPEKAELVKDEYEDDSYEEEGDVIEDDRYEQKMTDLKRIFPNKTNSVLSDLAYKLMPVDSVGYLAQGILANDNSIFYLPRKEGKLRLIHNISDPAQKDNIDGVWGTAEKAFYLLKDKESNYFFRYDIKSNAVTLLDKYPPHSHFTYIYSYKLRNNDYLLSFEVEINSQEADETLKLFRYTNGVLHKVEDYDILQDIKYLHNHNVLLLYYMKNGKRCLDVRNLNQ